MSEATKIEWCDSTFNPWIGCTKISQACDHCYAEAQMDTRMGRVEWGAGKPRSRTSAAYWKQPLRWNAQPFWKCDACGWRGDRLFLGQFCPPESEGGGGCGSASVKPARRRVFCASLADVFDNEVDPQWRADLFELIAATPNIDWLLLTKRIGNVLAMACGAKETVGVRQLIGSEFMRREHRLINTAYTWTLSPNPLPPNVWIGATVVNQTEADRDIPKLLTVPAAKRFLSIEPMLGPVELPHGATLDGDADDSIPGIDWIICGGESGQHARPMHPDWVRSLRDQCAAAGVPFLFKQWGEWLPINQQEEAFTNSLYKPNRVAREGRDQDALNESYGRRCTVPHGVVHVDGSFHSLHEPLAFLQGTGAMSTFCVGKRAAGRQLDGREHSEWPA